MNTQFFTKKRIIIVVLSILALFIIISFFSRKSDSIAEDSIRLKTVTTQRFSDGIQGEHSLEFIGTIKSSESLDLVPEAGGRITRVEVQEGSRVKKGDIIAVIDNSHEQLAYQRALASLESQQLVLNNLRKEFNQADSSTYSHIISQQEQSVQSAYQAFLNNDLRAYPSGNDPESVHALPPVISGTYQGTEEGQYILEMYRSVAPSGYSLRVSGLETGIYSASTQFPTALGEKGLFLQFPDQGDLREQTWVIDIPNKRSSQYLNAKNAYEATLSGKNLTLQQTKVTEDAVRQQENAVRQMNLAVQEASLMLSKKIMRAPFDGELTSLSVRVGDSVNLGQTVGSFKNLDTLELEFFVSPREATMITQDTAVLVDGERVGSVFFVASVLDNQGKIRVKAILDTHHFTEGSSLSFSLELEESSYEIYDGSTIIPLTALSMKGNQPFVATLGVEDKVSFIPVKTGILFGDMIEVSFDEQVDELILDARGLRAGEQVLRGQD